MRYLGNRLSVPVFSVFLISFLSVAGSVPASAQDKSVTFGVENFSNLPFYGQCNFTYCGFGRELIDQFAQDTGVTVKYEEMPILALHRALVLGEVDYKFPANELFSAKVKEGQAIHYSKPVVDFLDGVIMRANNDGEITRVGLIRGFTVDQTAFDGARFFRADDDEELIRMLMGREVDAVYANFLAFRHQLKQAGVDPGLVTLRDDLPAFRAAYHVSSMSEDNINKFNAWMDAHADDIAALKAKHGLVLGD